MTEDLKDHYKTIGGGLAMLSDFYRYFFYCILITVILMSRRLVFEMMVQAGDTFVGKVFLIISLPLIAWDNDYVKFDYDIALGSLIVTCIYASIRLDRRRIEAEVETGFVDQSHFCVLITNLQKGITRTEIIDQIRSKGYQPKSVKMISTNLKDCDKYVFREDLDNLQDGDGEYNSFNTSQIDSNIMDYNNSEEEVVGKAYISKCIILFDNLAERNKFYNFYRQNILNWIFKVFQGSLELTSGGKTKLASCERLPEIQDINWNGMITSNLSKTVRIVFFVIVLGLIMTLSIKLLTFARLLTVS